MLLALDRVTVAVRDLDAATRGYARLLGRSPSWEGEHSTSGAAYTLFRIDNTSLELLAPEGAKGRPSGEPREGPEEGLVALAFETREVAWVAATLRGNGFPSPEPREEEERDLRTGATRSWRRLVLPPAATRHVAVFVVERRADSPAPIVPEPLAPAAACVSALDHVVVHSADLEQSRTVYGERLGLRLALDRSFPERGLRLLFFRVGGVTVELVGGLDAAADPARPDRLGGLAYRVPDVAATASRLAGAGFDVSAVRDGFKPGTRVCTVRSGTHGVPTLILGPTPA